MKPSDTKAVNTETSALPYGEVLVQIHEMRATMEVLTDAVRGLTAAIQALIAAKM